MPSLFSSGRFLMLNKYPCISWNNMNSERDAADLPKQIRVSLGSAIVLGLVKGKLDAAPTTAYFMTYNSGKCAANCHFCPQARESTGRADMLSRVSWPVFPTDTALDQAREAVEDGMIRRVCIQALNYPTVFNHLHVLVKKIRRLSPVSVSVSCQPLNRKNMKLLKKAGVERIGIPLDAATRELFDKVKGASAGGPYDWDTQFRLLEDAVDVFGRGKVSTHLIVGLGETDREMVSLVHKCVDSGVLPALFAFTPVSGTALENSPQPLVQRYRRIQVARHVIVSGVGRCGDMCFDENCCLTDFGVDQHILLQIIRDGKPFQTSGCPDCNRPYYNEKPSGPVYNYPRPCKPEEISEIKRDLSLTGA